MDIKQQILQKSEELFMRFGIKSVSMDDIARELGISKKTLYQVVENKSDLIGQIFQCQIEEEKGMMEVIREESADAVEEIMRIADYVTTQLRRLTPAIMYDLQKYYHETWKDMDALHQAYVYHIIRDNLERGIRQGVYRADLHPDIIAKLYVGKTSLVADDELFPLKDYNIGELFIQHIFYHLYGVVSPLGLKLIEQRRREGLSGEQASG